MLAASHMLGRVIQEPSENQSCYQEWKWKPFFFFHLLAATCKLGKWLKITEIMWKTSAWLLATFYLSKSQHLELYCTVQSASQLIIKLSSWYKNVKSKSGKSNKTKDLFIPPTRWVTHASLEVVLLIPCLWGLGLQQFALQTNACQWSYKVVRRKGCTARSRGWRSSEERKQSRITMKGEGMRAPLSKPGAVWLQHGTMPLPLSEKHVLRFIFLYLHVKICISILELFLFFKMITCF